MSNHEQLVFDSAITFIRAALPTHLPGHEPALIDNCMDFLQGQYGLSARKAERVSHCALAEAQSPKGDIVIDMEMSNSHVVFLRDLNGNGMVFAFSASKLRELAMQHGAFLSHS